MKQNNATILRMAAMGVALCAASAGCGAEAKTISTTDMDPVMSADAGAEPQADAGRADAQDAGSVKPPVDCSHFTPVAVDMAFSPDGWMGDAVTGVKFVDCSVPRASATALGGCHELTYTPPAMGMGWAGISWQHPSQYWDDPPKPLIGYPMPCGATAISFYAKGKVGGESVDFWGGNAAYQAKMDKVILTKDWKQYTLLFKGKPDDNVTLGFGWAMGADATGAAKTATFYLDDIHWE